MTVDVAPGLLAVQAVARLEATRLHLAGGALVCHAAPRPEAGGPASYPALARIPFADGVGTVSALGLVLIAPIEGQCLQAGEISWCRIETASGEWVADMNAADVHLDVLRILPGAFVRLPAGVFR